MIAEHKAYASQHSRWGLMKGNAFTNIQTSGFVRASTQTECRGAPSQPPGALQDFDLKVFSDLPDHVRKQVKYLAKGRDVILYQIFHRPRPSCKKTIHGHIVTTTDHSLLYAIHNGRRKSEEIIETAIKELTE